MHWLAVKADIELTQQADLEHGDPRVLRIAAPSGIRLARLGCGLRFVEGNRAAPARASLGRVARQRPPDPPSNLLYTRSRRFQGEQSRGMNLNVSIYFLQFAVGARPLVWTLETRP